MPLTSGTRLGPYEILEPIGAGGMGEVYRARDTKLDREVAVKVLPEEFASDPERLARFEREAKLLASLNHPNIASIHGFEESDGVNGIVLELVEGPTLAERIEQGPIPVDEAIAIAKQIADALEAGHEAGVIHRDLKPANIKLREDGTVKVLDYGLAKALEGETAAGADSELSQSPTLARDGTQVGVILGTAAYMSPEQGKGKRVDRRADIWAFGAVVFEMLTGKRAFGGEDVSDTLAAVLKDEPNWERLPPETPRAIRVLLRRCLRKNPVQRLHDAADVRIEIEDVAGAPEVSAYPVGAPSGAPSKALFYAMALAAAIATAVAVWPLFRPSASAVTPVTRTVIPLASGEPLFLTARPTVALSTDGEKLAYVTTDGNTTRLYLRSLDELQATPVEGGDGASMPFFSPNSQWLGFARGGSLMKVSVSGGAPFVLCKLGSNSPRGASWTSEGTIVFVPSSLGGLQRIPEDGGEPEVLKRPDREQGEKTYRFPDVLPGGRAVVFTVGTSDIESWDDAAIALLSLQTGEYRVLLEGGSHATYSPTGHLVYARSGSLFAVAFDLDRLEVTGTPMPVVDDVITSPTKGPAPFSVSRSGSLLYAPGDPWGVDLSVVSVDREGRSEPLIETRRAYERANPSPDGDMLALAIDNANAELWLYDMTRGTSTRLVSGFDNNAPTWSPDGKRLAFQSNRAGANQLYWQDAAGRGEPERLVSHQYPQYPSSWSPDGGLAFNEFHPETGWDLWVLAFDGEGAPKPFLRTPASEVDPMFSPDGRWIAYQSDETGQPETYLRAFPDSGEKWQISTEGGTYAVWSPDGYEIFYRDDNKMMAVDFQAVDGRPVLGQPAVLFERDFVYDAYTDVYYSMLPDGERFVLIDGSEVAPPKELVLVQNWFEELKRLVPTSN